MGEIWGFLGRGFSWMSVGVGDLWVGCGVGGSVVEDVVGW